MALTLAEIRAKLQSQDNRNTNNFGDGAVYAHWNIPEGTSSRFRFLPDGNPNNPFFWVERAMIKLPFAGIIGQADSKPCIVQVPCMEMYGETCPVLAEVRGWFKDPALEEQGRRYWKKKSYLFQGFVRESALAEDKAPENPIRRFMISPQIFNLVKNALMDPEMESIPTDYQNGLDFIIKKASKGGYADYSTSSWARKESALSQADLDVIEQYSLPNLADSLPKKPTAAEVDIIKEMFEASVNGEAYDPGRWSAYFKPAGFKSDSDAPAAADHVPPTPPQRREPVVTPVSTVQEAAPFDIDDEDAEDDASNVAVAPVTVTKPAAVSAEDILARIRNRPKQ